jgi:hypothetical protein
VHTIFAMIMWVGGAAGGPATISGFHSVDACQAAIPMVEMAFDETELADAEATANVKFGCVALDAGDEAGYEDEADAPAARNPDDGNQGKSK